MQAVAQRLTAAGVPMVEFPQSIPNLTESSTNLWELIKGANLVVYPDSDLRLVVQRAVAVETPRGWKISKTSASHKIDAVVALGMAALGAIGDASRSAPFILSPEGLQKMRSLPPRDRFAAQRRDRFTPRALGYR
jgi:phage terminase large subunit-like protein